jgi:hypothetical protein
MMWINTNFTPQLPHYISKRLQGIFRTLGVNIGMETIDLLVSNKHVGAYDV